MILFLNTTNLNKIRFALINPAGKTVQVRSKTVKIPYEHSHKTLEYFAKFLRSQRVNRQSASLNLQSLIVCSGPGSFTGIRVGVSLVQALGFAWGIPIRAIKTDQVPQNLKDLARFRGGRKLTVDYGKNALL